jgi:hypothetical protein
MGRATTAPDTLAGDPDRDCEAHAHAPKHETERRGYDSAKLNEAVRSKQVIEAEHQGEGREEREQHQ